MATRSRLRKLGSQVLDFVSRYPFPTPKIFDPSGTGNTSSRTRSRLPILGTSSRKLLNLVAATRSRYPFPFFLAATRSRPLPCKGRAGGTSISIRPVGQCHLLIVSGDEWAVVSRDKFEAWLTEAPVSVVDTPTTPDPEAAE